MNRLMTLDEVGKYLRFTRKTIYRLLKQGSIPAVKIGNKWRFDKTAIDRWIQQYANQDRVRILVISDDFINGHRYKQTLEMSGHTIVTLSDSNEGIGYLKRDDFDMILLDYKMRDLIGAGF